MKASLAGGSFRCDGMPRLKDRLVMVGGRPAAAARQLLGDGGGGDDERLQKVVAMFGSDG